MWEWKSNIRDEKSIKEINNRRDVESIKGVFVSQMMYLLHDNKSNL